MKHNALKISLLIVAFCALLMMPSNASIEASDYLSSYGAYITKSGNVISIHFEVEGTRRMDYLGVTHIYLYERASSNDSWSHVKTYLSSDPLYESDMMGTNTTFKMDSVTYSGTSTYQYKAYVTVYAEKDGGSDSRSIVAN